MEPLKTTKWVLAWLCVYSASETASEFKRTAYTIFTAVDYIGHFCGVLTHFAYFLKYLSTDLAGAVFAFMGTTTFIGVTYVMTSLSLHRDQINDMFKKLDRIYDLREWIF